MAPLLSRLRKDLSELQESPYPGVEVFIDDANLHKFCLVLTPPSGPWKDLRLHFDVELPSNWPAAPPSIRNSVSGINHPNLFGGYICCDLLKLEFYEEHGYDGGYTPALSLRGLFLQFLTFFSSTRVEQQYGGYIDIGDYDIDVVLLDSEIGKGLLGNMTWRGRTRPAMHQKWDSHPSPETTVTSYHANTNETKHLFKPAIPGHPGLHLLQMRNPLWSETLGLIQRWRCPTCPYGSDTLPHHRKEGASSIKDSKINSLTNPTLSCPLDLLHDDALIELANTLPTESVISMSKAYHRFRSVVEATHLLLQRELVCFFLKVPLRECVLGIGIGLDTRARTLSSDYDWLSEDAFKVHGVRKSIRKSPITHFLPLAFSQAHFDRVHDKIWKWLKFIDHATWTAERNVSHGKRNSEVTDLRAKPPTTSHGSVRVLFKLMNNSVVSLMKSCDDAIAGGRREKLVLASERAVYSYVILFHLLICLCRKNRLLLDSIIREVQEFLANPRSRVKKSVPDLGEFIVKVTLVLALPNSPVTWQDMCGAVLEEAVIRHVRWTLKEAPELEVLEIGESRYRLEKTFAQSKTGLRLLMFQVTFLRLFINTYAGKLGLLDANYGFAEPVMAERMVEEAKGIYKIGTWPEFFHKVKFAKGTQLNALAFCNMLREAVRKSAQRSYHRPSPPEVMGKLVAEREKMGR